MFKAEVTYEYEDFLSWSRLYARTGGRKKRLIFFVVYGLILAAVLAFLLLGTHDDGFDSLYLAVILILAASLVTVLLKPRIKAAMNNKVFSKSIGTQYLTFNDDAVYVLNDKSEGRHFYSGFQTIYEDSERFYLLLDERQALLLPKRCFTEGAPDEFSGFISEKTGHEVITK